MNTFNAPWNVRRLRHQGTRQWFPQTGVEENQGPPSMRPGELERLQIPRDPGVQSRGFVNPYSMTFYGPILLFIARPTIVLQSNQHRCYLLLQNQGPGNIWINFGADAAQVNSLELVTTQALEQIGGGFVKMATGENIPQAFVASDYISAITDTAGTTMLAGEGVARFAV
jgi:hypothetical protein